MLVNDEKDIEQLNEFNEKYKTIEEILKRYFNDNDLRVLKMKCVSGSKDGDNYMSVVKRIIVSEYEAGGRRLFKSLSLIVKRHIKDKARRELFRCDAAFKNEITAYCHVVPVLKRFSNNNLPLPNLYFAGCDKEGEIIAMDDLVKEGLRMVDRLDGFDFEHSSIVMKELANFHGLSLAMKIIEPKIFSTAVQYIEEIVFIEAASDFYSQQLDDSLNQAITSLSQESNENGEFDSTIKILKTLKGPKLFNIMKNHVTNSEEKWNVIVHGDLWSNNIMFHYGKNGRVNYAKFVDLQTLRYSNLVCDILMVMFSSTKFKMRQQHLDELIDIYRNSLIDTLREHLKGNYSCELAELEEMYTTESIKQEIARRSLFGLGMSLWVLPAITFVANVKDIDSLLNSLNDSDKHDEIVASMKSHEYHIRVRDIMRDFKQRGYLNNIFIDV